VQAEGVFLSGAAQPVYTWVIWVVGAAVSRVGGSETLMHCEVRMETGPWASPTPSPWGRTAGSLECTLEFAGRLQRILAVAEAPEHNRVSWEGSCMLDWWESSSSW